MYYYAPDDNRRGRRAGLAAAACYLAAFLAVSVLVSFHADCETHSEGILIDFGDDTDGSGAQNVALSQAEETYVPPAESHEEYLTQEHEQAPVLTTGERQQERANASAEQPRQVNRRALFPGRSTTSEATSQGSGTNTAGNRGHESGGDGSSAGTGTGTEGISFDLKGRRAIGSLPTPAYESNDAQGIVIVEITVDAAGRVQSAAFKPQGSTTQDARLLDAALKAARQARFTASEANAVQTGTITYEFRLR